MPAAQSGDFATALREWTPLTEQGNASAQKLWAKHNNGLVARAITRAFATPEIKLGGLSVGKIGETSAQVAGVSIGLIFMIFGWVSWPLAIYALSEWWEIHWLWAALITAVFPFIPFGGIANLALAVYGIVLLLS